MSAPLPSPEEQAVIDRFEAAQPAPESWNPCPVVVHWLDDSPDTQCVLRRGHDGGHIYDAGLFQ